jgi:hypothetical protein
METIKTSKLSNFFKQQVDELVQSSDKDPHLKEALGWVDEQAKKHDVSFYEMIFHILYRYHMDNKARQWARERN